MEKDKVLGLVLAEGIEDLFDKDPEDKTREPLYNKEETPEVLQENQPEKTDFGSIEINKKGVDPLDLDFNALWEQQYSKSFMDYARNNKQLMDGIGTADDLYQELWLNVWRKAVEKWPNYYQKSKKPNFYAWVCLLLKNFTIDLGRRKHTGPRQFIQNQDSLDRPIQQEEGETYLSDLVGDPNDNPSLTFEEKQERLDILNRIKNPKAKAAAEIIMDNPDIMGTGEMWDKIRKATGHQRQKVLQLLRDEPALQEMLNFTRRHASQPATK